MKEEVGEKGLGDMEGGMKKVMTGNRGLKVDAEGRVGKRTWKRKGQKDVEDEGGRVMVDAGSE